MKFEKKQRKVVYVASEDVYRVTAEKTNRDKREPLDSGKNLVGVANAVAFWDNVDRREHCLGCARTVKEAWDSGDRYLLDTDEARRAAELVSDLASSRPDDIDICSALVDLLNAIAKVRMSDTKMEDFEVLDACVSTMDKCSRVEGFGDWKAVSRRRRFMYELPKAMRTDVTITLIGLYFECGNTPLLTTRQRQDLMSLDRGEGVEGAAEFFDGCLRQMTAYRFA